MADRLSGIFKIVVDAKLKGNKSLASTVGGRDKVEIGCLLG